MSKKIPLYWLLVLQFTIQVTTIVGIVGYISYRSGQKTVAILVNQLMEKISDRTQQQLSSYFNTTRAVSQSNAILLQQGVFDGYDLEVMERHYVQQLKIMPKLTTVAIANEDGEFLSVERLFNDSLIIRKLDTEHPNNEFYRYQADTEGKNKTLQETRNNYNPHNDPPDNPWYQRAKQSKEGIWTIAVTLSQGEKQPILHLVKFLPFYDQTGKFDGVLGSSIYLTQLGDFLKEINKNHQGQLLVIDENGFLIATSTGEMPFDSTPKDSLKENVNVKNRRLKFTQSQNPLTLAIANLITAKVDLQNHRQEPQLLQLTHQKEKYFVKINPLKQELDLLMVTVIPESEFMGEVNKNLQNTANLTIIALIVAIAVSLFTSKRITRSLSILTQATNKFSQNHQIPPSLPNSNIEEISLLTTSFLEMIEAIRESDELKNSNPYRV